MPWTEESAFKIGESSQVERNSAVKASVHTKYME
jgi:hypothetical protein